MALRHLPGPLFSCWPVITEAAWLLRGHPRAVQQLLGSLDGGFLELLSLSGSEGTAIAEVIRGMRTFALNSRTPRWFTWPRESVDTIFTLDQRDFSAYRSGRRRPFRILPEL